MPRRRHRIDRHRRCDGRRPHHVRGGGRRSDRYRRGPRRAGRTGERAGPRAGMRVHAPSADARRRSDNAAAADRLERHTDPRAIRAPSTHRTTSASGAAPARFCTSGVLLRVPDVIGAGRPGT
jgi:hypothetical protein